MNEEEPWNAGGRTGTHTEQFDWSADDEPSVAVVEAVANSRGCSETDLERLDEAIDPDALDALFSPRYDGTPRGEGSVSFRYAGHTVTVFSDGEVVVSLRRWSEPDTGF